MLSPPDNTKPSNDTSFKKLSKLPNVFGIKTGINPNSSNKDDQS